MLPRAMRDTQPHDILMTERFNNYFSLKVDVLNHSSKNTREGGEWEQMESDTVRQWPRDFTAPAARRSQPASDRAAIFGSSKPLADFTCTCCRKFHPLKDKIIKPDERKRYRMNVAGETF